MFSYFQCCQCQVSKKNNEYIDVNAAFDEGINPWHEEADALHVSNNKKMLPSTPSTPSTNDCNQSMQTQRSSDSEERQAKQTQQTGTAHSMKEEDRLAEKAELQAMVKSFTKASTTQGLSCKLSENQGGTAGTHQHTHAMFFLDKALTKMVFKQHGRRMEIPLLDVVEAFSYEELMKIMPDTRLGNSLKIEERSSAIFIQYQNSGDGCEETNWLTLLVSDGEWQERFTDCINIFRFYAEEKAQSPSQKQL